MLISVGAEIREYYERVVEEYGVAPNLKLKHEVLHAQWLSETSQWQIRVKDLETGEEKTETADFFVSAQGRLNSWKWPDVPGLHYFKGTLCHTSKYDTSFDHIGKKVAIIGNGASGVQILPNILPETAHIDHYIRSKGWVAPAFRGNLFEVKADQPGGPKYTEEERKLWKKYPELYLEYRRSLEKHFHGGFKGGILGTPENEAFRKQCIQTTRDRLDGDEELLAKILPDYTPGCKRPTPAPGYIESLRDPKVELITNKIIAVTETGIVTEDGKHREVDAIIAATGHWNGFLPRFPTIGENGVDLSKLWAAGGPLGYPDTYFGVMAPDFPNYFFVLQVC
jgi:cation diffusion facilitator CzcD-associated flavoprotein CzcO